MATESKPKFVYTIEMRDSDAMNARSAAYRVVRDAAKLPSGDDAQDEKAKTVHNACAMAARGAANVAFKALTEQKPRDQWTDEQAAKALAFVADVGTKAYRAAIAAQGYPTPDEIVAKAAKMHEARMIERRAQAETEFAVAQATGIDAAAKSIFG